MNRSVSSPYVRVRRHPIAACVSTIFVLAAPTATLAATVTSCLDDGGPGTLRSVVTGATEGATVDFAGLDCSAQSDTITLSATRYYVPVTRNSLTIDGSGAVHPISIDASKLPRGYYSNRVITHSGTGTLTIKNLTLENGYVEHAVEPASGGCLSSSGSVTLNSVTVTGCTITSTAGLTPTGGGVYTKGDLTLQESTVSYSTATGNADAKGGGVYVVGNLSLQNSFMEHNSATAGTAAVLGGGAFVKGNLTLHTSSISYNTATTVAGNGLGGGAYVNGNLNVSNAGESTLIAHNSVSASSISGLSKGGGAFTGGDFYAQNGCVVGDNSASAGFDALGGGLYVSGALTLKECLVTYNTTYGQFRSYGGGALVIGDSTTSYSNIAYNKAFGNGYGGGLRLAGPTNTIASSTVSGNLSYGTGGGVEALAAGSGTAFKLYNSTISRNEAALIGGLYLRSADVKLFNSTIAFNTALSATNYSPGVQLSALTGAVAANLQSTLISNNAATTGTQNDLSILENGANHVTFNGGSPSSSPAHNLVYATAILKLPTDTKIGFCPFLGPLRDNGGLTRTHALMSNSPAIDKGSDSSLSALYDQRGSAAVNGKASYTRFSGLTALADIGAYEVQQPDIVFYNTFDGCVPL